MTILGLRGTSAVLENDFRDRDQSQGSLRRRDRSSSSSRLSSQDRSQGGTDTRKQLVQSAKSALLAGAGEAFRSRKEPRGPKRKRVLTAAVSAGAINVLLNNDKKDGQGGGKIQVAESVVGGLAVNYLVHGSRHQNRSPSRGRRDGNDTNGERRDARSQTETRIATASRAASMNGNKSRDRNRRYSSSDLDSVGEEKKRGKSMGDLARAGMAKLRLRSDKSGDDTSSRGV